MSNRQILSNRYDINVFDLLQESLELGRDGPSNPAALGRPLGVADGIYRVLCRTPSPQGRFLPKLSMEMWDCSNTAPAEIRGISRALGRATDGLKLEYFP